MGTIVEIITFYLIKAWGLEHSTAIEKPLPEFGNEEITHNVEFSLHPSTLLYSDSCSLENLPLTANKIARSFIASNAEYTLQTFKSNVLLDKQNVLRNSCTIGDTSDHYLTAYHGGIKQNAIGYSVVKLHKKPYAIFECKRVGVEEGMKKGPQTIEKAKQGAYVARTVSSLQRFRAIDGRLYGLIPKADGSYTTGEYFTLMEKVINSNDKELLSRFVLTIGVVSNHGNWFTSEHHNKEIMVLAQSYDWLIFLTDEGISFFTENFILKPLPGLAGVRDAFYSSYSGKKGSNRFTKVKMDIKADLVLKKYFSNNLEVVESWFNIITPKKDFAILRHELKTLQEKDWQAIHS